jgi:aminopeptidase YwaD
LIRGLAAGLTAVFVLGACAVQSGCGRAADLPLPELAGTPPITVPNVLEHVGALPVDRHPGGSGHSLARTVLRDRLRAWGYEVREHVFVWAGLPGRDLVNLEVRLPAADDGGPFVLVGAHWDAVPRSPGADDNGSGVAVVLELARRLAGRKLPAEVRMVFFDAEEAGLAGSREYAQAMTLSERARCVGMIDLEAVGYTDRGPDSQRMPAGSRWMHDPGTVGDFILVLGNQASRALAETVGLALGFEDPSVMRPEVFSALPGEGWLMPDSRRSDHASFWDVGIPAVMVTDTANFRNPHYHRPSDTVETLDGEFLAAVARGVERAVLLLAEGGGD